jgi:hypothetical protein
MLFSPQTSCPAGSDVLTVLNLMGEPQVWAHMCARFPWVADERGDIGEGLVHLDFAALRQGLERAIDEQDGVTIADILAFTEELFASPDLLHPDVVNAIEISFLEDLYLGSRQHREFILPRLGPACRVRWDEIASAYGGTAG